MPSEVLGGSFSDRLQAVVSELLPAKKKPSKKAAEKAVVAATAAPAVAVKRKHWFSLPHIDIVGFLKRTFTPFRLLMMAMTVVVGLTVYWMTYQRAVENAQQTWLKSPEEIEGLLNDSKMVELQQTLQTAVQAADLLQRDDPESRRIRNMLGETMAINSIASSELLTAFHNAYNDEGVLQETAASEIEDVCRSGTFLFD